MAAFQYRYSFSVDDEIIGRYGSRRWSWFGDTILETRVKFIVKGKGKSGEREIIDSESYAVGAFPKEGGERFLKLDIGMRLKDYGMPDRKIRTMIRQLLIFAEKKIYASGPRRRGKIPLAVDLEVRTVQRKGEDMGAAKERAMKPAYLPPLYIYDVVGPPWPPVRDRSINMIYFRKNIQAATIRVGDVDKAGSVMKLCRICGCKPMIGTQISSLPCSHAFHYHCLARVLIENGNCCPICHHPSAFEQSYIRNGFGFGFDDADGDFMETFVRETEALEALQALKAGEAGLEDPAPRDSHL